MKEVFGVQDVLHIKKNKKKATLQSLVQKNYQLL